MKTRKITVPCIILLMGCALISKPEEYAFEPIWCAWRYGRNFTVKEILHTLPKVKELGFKRVGIDDGYQQAIGDRHTNKSQFPGGDSEMKAMVYYAVVPQTAYYGDQVELINDDFASQIGVGGVPGSKFVWPKLHAPGEQGLLLTTARDSLFKKWVSLYNKTGLSRSDYLGDLYDIGYDYLETPCIKKDAPWLS